ncbi:unnamed protein product [Gongylonema pulchrum]|uniref:Uncharacterized protein n=1 Tax=Gongylonema pulchrum TaxID=637853 RepID=A0A183DP58_9BILA|nr:unnamed protein product [Gongylonema pulchrum]
MGKSRECTATVCRNGVTLGSMIDAFLPAVAKIPFWKVGELAKAITFWDSEEKLKMKETILRKNPWNTPVVAKKGWRKELSASAASDERITWNAHVFWVPRYIRAARSACGSNRGGPSKSKPIQRRDKSKSCNNWRITSVHIEQSAGGKRARGCKSSREATAV